MTLTISGQPLKICNSYLDFSFTHVIPYWRGQKIKEAIMRIDVGGKLLTNYLKELVSYRQLNLMDEYLVCHKMKELACYCTLDFKELFEKSLDKKPRKAQIAFRGHMSHVT